jgi:hypothetical protein
MIIKPMNKKICPIEHNLASIMIQAKYEASKMQEISFFHVLRNHNHQIDSLANKTIKLKMKEI